MKSSRQGHRNAPIRAAGSGCCRWCRSRLRFLATPSRLVTPAGSPQLPLASRLPPGRGPAVNPREMKTERSEGKNGEILGAQAVLNENSTKRDAERRFRISTASANRIRTRNSPAARKTSLAGKRPGFAPRGVKSCTFRGSRVFHPEELRA